MPGAFETLLWHYQNRSAEALSQHNAGVPVVGFTSNTVPWELIRAAGCFPVLLDPGLDSLAEPTPRADPLMEPVFESRIRHIFDAILSGTWRFLQLMIIPRTSEPEYKLYLYLREVERQNLTDAVPPLCLYDLLHTRSPISRKYGLDRTKDLIERLKRIGPISGKSLLESVRESNRARAALRRLHNLRAGDAPRIAGADALAISGALYFMNRVTYAKLVDRVCREIQTAKPLRGPRLLIKGAPLNHPYLHRVLEANGAVVTAEDDWWGARAGEAKIGSYRTAMSSVRAVFENYYLCAPSPRVSPASAADAWFQKSVKRGIDGVIFYLPPDDDVYGWDYPRHRDFARARGLPSLLIREEAGRGLSLETNGRVRDFVEAIHRRRHA
ncbi:MAG TPA: 2-hydroxyacyl-CoA dehydratase family protein [Candidatus Acidoferrales bacterium]|nr:2-hydroxyacyl-CoA dehydratase family protein [Candidatus Acidoferrales bacterium]